MNEVAQELRPRVLVVEDEEIVAFSIAKVLRLHGFDPEIASTVSASVDALDASASRPFAHVLLDLKLPDADGENVLSHAERMPNPPQVIVVASPHNVDGYRMGSIRGRCEYLPKPVIFEQLLALLRQPGDGLVGEYARTFSLSPQERAVMEHAVRGDDDDQIGESIRCARTTVKSYWVRIYAKVGERRRDQVLAHFARWLMRRQRRSGSYSVAPPAHEAGAPPKR